MTAVLLALTTAAMAEAVATLAGRGYLRETHSTRDLIERVVSGGEQGALSSTGLIALLMPVIANAMVFVPWGFLTFILIDRSGRSRLAAHLGTLTAGIVLAVALWTWQLYLPTRVTALSDLFAYAVGTFAGSILGQIRKDVRLRFDF